MRPGLAAARARRRRRGDRAWGERGGSEPADAAEVGGGRGRGWCFSVKAVCRLAL